MSAPDERSQAIANLASALNACFDLATEKAAERAADRAAEKAVIGMKSYADRAAEKAADRVKAELIPRLDRQDETLRMVWKQVKGNGKLPIDD